MEILYKGVDIYSHNAIIWSKVNPKEIDFIGRYM